MKTYPFLLLLFWASFHLNAQIKSINYELEPKSEILGQIDLNKDGFLLLTGVEYETRARPREGSFVLHRFNSNLDLSFSVELPYTRSKKREFLNPEILITPKQDLIYVLWQNKEQYTIHQIKPDGTFKKISFQYDDKSYYPLRIYCTDESVVFLNLMDKTEKYSFKQLDHESLEFGKDIRLNVPRLKGSLSKWEFLAGDNEKLLFKKRSMKFGKNEKGYESHQYEITVRSFNYRGKRIGEIKMKPELEGLSIITPSRTVSKISNSSLTTGFQCNNKDRRLNHLIKNFPFVTGEYKGSPQREGAPHMHPQATAYGTLVYRPESKTFLFYGLHSGDFVPDWLERECLRGIFFSTFDEQGKLIKHVQYAAPPEIDEGINGLNEPLNVGYHRAMSLRILNDQKMLFKVSRKTTLYHAKINTDLSLEKQAVFEIDMNPRYMLYWQLEDRIQYPEKHPVNQYLMGDLLVKDDDLYEDLFDHALVRTVNGAPGEEILYYFVDSKERKTLKMMVFQE